MNNCIYAQFGKNLEVFREHKGYSISTMAEIMEVSRTTYRKYESCEATPNIFMLFNIVSGLQLEIDELVKLSPDELKKRLCEFDTLPPEEYMVGNTVCLLSPINKGRILEYARILEASDKKNKKPFGQAL